MTQAEGAAFLEELRSEIGVEGKLQLAQDFLDVAVTSITAEKNR